MSVKCSPDVLHFTQISPQTSVITLTLPGSFQPGVSQIVANAQSNDVTVARPGSIATWQGDKVPGGVLTSYVQVTPYGRGVTNISVRVQVGVMPDFETKTALISVTSNYTPAQS